MSEAGAIGITLLPGARRLLELHARELPQRDDLCGAFCGALALGAAGVAARDGGALDQDAVAIAAGSVISAVADPRILPHGEGGRRDYRLAIPRVEDAKLSGTTAAGVREAIEHLSGGALVAIPLAGPWSAAALDGIYESAAALERAVSLIANVATHHLWGSHPSPVQLLAQLLDGEQAGPEPDWRVGHFACVVGRVHGPGGSLYVLADTYPALGDGGVHLQPRERLATALERSDMPAGGMLVILDARDAETIRDVARAIGLQERIWDNGTAAAGEL